MNALANWAILETTAHFSLTPEPDDAMLDSWRQTHRRYPWLVAEDDEKTFLGYAKAGPWKTRAAYRSSAEVTVYVHPDHHRKGVGRALYARLFGILRTQGYCTLVAGVTLPNEASVGLHEAMGMHKVAEFPRIGYKFATWLSVGYWAIELVAGAQAPGEILDVQQAADAPP